MFPQKGRKVPEIRFKEYAEDWEQRKLEDVLEVLKDGTHGTHADVDNKAYKGIAKSYTDFELSISRIIIGRKCTVEMRKEVIDYAESNDIQYSVI